jgi:succinate-semialdehyde dehydrogenase / glutarate-semialdehyde dehydrogenase
MAITSINPATGELLQEFSPLHRKTILARIESGAVAFQKHRSTDYAKRAQWLQAAAQILRDPKQSYRLAQLATIEMGKPITQALAELEKCAVVCEYYALNAAELLATEIVATDAAKSGIAYQPLGLVLAVMPWNFPFWQVFR